MLELSMATIKILAWSKVILALFLIGGIWLIYSKKIKAAYFLWLIGAAVVVFYAVMSWKLQKMFWGDNGDEVFVFSFLTKAMSAHPFGDFFYAHLPAFYPPLYFWVVGWAARFVTPSGITAAKIGAAAVLAVWFFGVYYLQKIYWRKKTNQVEIISSPWFWLALPAVAFLANDFNDLIFKPYEAISAILLVVWLGMLANELEERWDWKKYLLFGLSGGLLFLTYYFWWFFVVLSLLAWIILSQNKIFTAARIVLTGAIIFLVSLPYTLPLAITYARLGIENWQASYFYYSRFVTYVPFLNFSLAGALFLIGLAGLIIYRRNNFVRINLFLFLSCYAYQFLNIVLFLVSGKSYQAEKAFPYLATVSLAVGAAYLLVDAGRRFSGKKYFREAAAIVLVVIAISLPFGSFIDSPVVLQNLETDQQGNSAQYLSAKIKQTVPDYATRTWLSSGIPEINAYLPLAYYWYSNPSYSNPAVHWSVRFSQIKKMTEAKSADEFQADLNGLGADKFDTLLLYQDKNSQSYPLFYWQDNYPNAGKQEQLNLNPALISDKYWQKVFDDGEWRIFLAK